MHFRALGLMVLLGTLGGCGLALEYDAPDPQRGADAASIDAGPRDDGGAAPDTGAGADAGHDGGAPPTDAGLPDTSVIDPDTGVTDDPDTGVLDDPDGGVDASTSTDGGLPDTGVPDSGARDAGVDGGPLDPCLVAVDGTRCGDATGLRQICIEGRCVPSICGDLFVDMAVQEQCDDGNDVTGDGCEPFSCTFSCVSSLQCTDGFPCNGVETCNATRHVCVAGRPPVVLTPCSTPDGRLGTCDTLGFCIPEGCGDGIVQSASGEVCDDGNDASNDGCEADCSFSCTEDHQCSDDDVCNGVESCLNHRCVLGPTITCDVAPCYVGGCDPVIGCFATLIDDDGDGQAPIGAGPNCGTDCNDDDPNVFEGAPEQCNMRDDDCDGAIDDNQTTVRCFTDLDRDGFGGPTSRLACSCGNDSTPRGGDCFDILGNASASLVRPDQTQFFNAPYCRSAMSCSYDYNCDSQEEPQLLARFERCQLNLLNGICVGEGWAPAAGSAIPLCGQGADWVTCEVGLGGLGSGLICREVRTRRIQQCR